MLPELDLHAAVEYGTKPGGPLLPAGNGSLLVRTAFDDESRWDEVAAAAQAEYEEGFCAYVVAVSDPRFDGADWRAVRDAVPPSRTGASVLFIVDAHTLTDSESPILVVDLPPGGREPRSPFRCIPSELWGIENNLNIANMDWEDFADAADPDGVFRGFPSVAPPTPEQITQRDKQLARRAAAEAAAAEAAAAEAERQRRAAEQEAELRRWGGHAPSRALRAAGVSAPQFARQNYPLAEALAALDEQTQRQVQLWAVRYAVSATTQRHQEFFAPAVAALERDVPLPAPFNSPRNAWAALLDGGQVHTVMTVQPGHQRAEHREPLAPYAAALAAILATTRDEGVAAAMISAVDSAARTAADPAGFFARLRRTFDLPH